MVDKNDIIEPFEMVRAMKKYVDSGVFIVCEGTFKARGNKKFDYKIKQKKKK